MAVPPQHNVAQPPPAEVAAKKKVAILRAEVIMLLLLLVCGLGVWGLVDRAVVWLTKGWEPREGLAQIEHQVPWREASLAMTQDERKATEDQLIQARIELAKQTTMLAALDAVPTTKPTPTPAAEPNAMASKPVPSPAETVKLGTSTDALPTREDTLVKREAAARLVNDLIGRLNLLQTVSDDLTKEVEHSRWLATRDFNSGQLCYRVVRPLITFAATALVLLGLLRLLAPRARAAEARAEKEGYGVNTSLVVWAFVGLLLILVAYQTLEIAGAAFVGAVVLLLFLAWMQWPRQEGANAAKKQ
ncbi:MAG: hypothetical protein LC754_10030 [Acidobacteria bacterium]|nr:hypothetical protein [Acidobacteriota bacterium]